MTDVRKRQPTTSAELLAALETFDWAAWREQLRAFYVPLARDLVETRAGQVTDRFTFADPYASEVMTRYVGERIVQLDETTRTQLRALLQREFANWQAEGTTFDLGSKVRDAVRERYAGYQRWRADRIARTESAIVSNIGSALGAKAAGYTHVRVFDGDEDEECAAVNNTVQTVEWLLDHPIAHPNCVRSASPVVPEAVPGRGPLDFEPLPGRGDQRGRRQRVEGSPRAHASSAPTRNLDRLRARVETFDLNGLAPEEQEHIAGVINAALDGTPVLQRALRQVGVFDDVDGPIARGGQGRLQLNITALRRNLEWAAGRTAADRQAWQAAKVDYYRDKVAAIDARLAALPLNQRGMATALRAERARLEFYLNLHSTATRQFTYEGAADPLAAVVQHELAHVIRQAIEGETGRSWGGPDGIVHSFGPTAPATRAQAYGRVSSYAGEALSELFSEVHALLATGRGHEVPEWLAKAYRAYTEPQVKKVAKKAAATRELYDWELHGPSRVSEADRRIVYSKPHRPWDCADMFLDPLDDPSFADWIRLALTHVEEARTAGEGIPTFVTDAVPKLKEMLARFEAAESR